MTASFDHICEIYAKEQKMPVRLAYKLSHQILEPSPIERQNVQLTHSLFHQSTIEALNFYGKAGHPEYLQTASFLTIISNWWKTVNVKSKFLGQRKRDPFCEIVCEENLQEKTSFLRAFFDWLQEWEKASGETKLCFTTQTFLAAKLTSEGLAAVSEHLILQKKQEYVLLGKFQSDCLEGRFGKLRQMCGGNLFNSVRQFLESERTLKIKNLACLDLSLSEIQETFHGGQVEKQQQIERISEEIINDLKIAVDPKLTCLKNNDENSLFYVAGYFARTIKNHLKCSDCKQTLTSSNIPDVKVICENDPCLTAQENDSRTIFINQINRGGLVYPSEKVFSACILLWILYQKIRSSPAMTNKLFQSNISSQKLFTVLFLKTLSATSHTKTEFISFKCLEGHSFSNIVELIGKKFFNVVSKNFVSSLNSEIHSKRKISTAKENETKRNPSNLKIQKLQSGAL